MNQAGARWAGVTRPDAYAHDRENAMRSSDGSIPPPATPPAVPRAECAARRRRRAAASAAVHGLLAGALLGGALFATIPRAGAESAISHATAIREAPRYPADFPHYDHVNPNAPKGGTVRRASVGSTFDSLNPFIVKGNPAAGIGLLFDTLTEDSPGEATASYGLVAEWIEVADDGSWTTFWLRPEARFHDGSPVTPEDVAFSLEILKTKGHPFYRGYYEDVRAAEPVEGDTPSGPRRGSDSLSGRASTRSFRASSVSSGYCRRPTGRERTSARPPSIRRSGAALTSSRKGRSIRAAPSPTGATPTTGPATSR